MGPSLETRFEGPTSIGSLGVLNKIIKNKWILLFLGGGVPTPKKMRRALLRFSFEKQKRRRGLHGVGGRHRPSAQGAQGEGQGAKRSPLAARRSRVGAVGAWSWSLAGSIGTRRRGKKCTAVLVFLMVLKESLRRKPRPCLFF